MALSWLMRKTLTMITAVILAAIAAVSLSACSRLATIPAPPPGNTPADYLASRPYAELSVGGAEFIVTEPSSSVFILALGLLTIGLGAHFLKTRADQRSRFWWGLSFIAWGIGALLAGTSYQAFAYEIKSAGRAVSSWTSWWEIYYMLFTVASIGAMTMGVAHASAHGRLRKALTVYAVVDVALYFAVCLTGAFLPDKFLVSFELMVLFTWPGYVAFFVINVRRYLKNRAVLDRSLMVTWGSLFVVMGGYYAYLLSGLGEALWARGLWFNANDFLHAGLIGWMAYIRLKVSRELRDERE